MHRLMVAGGLALVCHDEDEVIEPQAGWTSIRAGRRTTLLQAPGTFADASGSREIPGPRWVLGEAGQRCIGVDGPSRFARAGAPDLRGDSLPPVSSIRSTHGRTQTSCRRSTSSAARTRKIRREGGLRLFSSPLSRRWCRFAPSTPAADAA